MFATIRQLDIASFFIKLYVGRVIFVKCGGLWEVKPNLWTLPITEFLDISPKIIAMRRGLKINDITKRRKVNQQGQEDGKN